MNKFIIGAVLFISAGAAVAACGYQIFTGPDGRTITCTTCCDQRGNCNTVCS